MLFKLINTSNLEWDKAVDFEADSIDAACEYVLKNAYKFSNWRILQDDTVELSYKTVDGHWFIAAFIDLHKNEVVTKLYDGRRAPEPYVENAEQGEPVDVENNTASEQGNTVENASCSMCVYRDDRSFCGCYSSVEYNHAVRHEDSCMFFLDKYKFNDVFRFGG